jgi:hypothetical protein
MGEVLRYTEIRRVPWNFKKGNNLMENPQDRDFVVFFANGNEHKENNTCYFGYYIL